MKRIIQICIISIMTLIIVAFAIIKIKDIKIVRDADDIKIYSNINSYEQLFDKEYYKIIISENNETKEYSYSDFNISIDFDSDTKEYLENNIFLYKDNIKLSFDYTNLYEELNKLNINRNHPTSAYIIKEDNNIKIINEIPANYLVTEKLYEYIIENVGSTIKIELSKFYEDFSTNDIRDKQCLAELSKLLNTYVAYSNETELHLKDLSDFIDIVDNKIVLINTDTEEYYNIIKNWVVNNLESYNTVGKERLFTTTNGDTIEIVGGTWGDICDFDLETNYIIDLFNSFSNENDRKPILKQDYDNDIPSTYIEISINDQYLWYYKDNKLLMESKVVTGTKGKHDTPLGIYYISEKIDGKYLRGDDYVTWVNKWLRITNRGHGLHDATWRSSFGGKIYTYNGSHGCINLPKKFAYDLFDNVTVKCCVIIY